LRTLQFIRAPTLLHDYHTLENAIGEHLPRPVSPLKRLAPERFRLWLYRLALERGYLDTMLTAYVATPFVRILRRCDALERGWTDFLAREPSREDEPARTPAGALEELA
jgi:NAD(P)H-quinone oxidoreductase subunit 5